MYKHRWMTVNYSAAPHFLEIHYAQERLFLRHLTYRFTAVLHARSFSRSRHFPRYMFQALNIVNVRLAGYDNDSSPVDRIDTKYRQLTMRFTSFIKGVKRISSFSVMRFITAISSNMYNLSTKETIQLQQHSLSNIWIWKRHQWSKTASSSDLPLGYGRQSK